MCYFVALAVTEKKLAQELLSGYVVSDNNNQTLAKAVPKGYTWLWITNGGCSCSLVKSISQLEKEIAKVQKKLKIKHQKRGWEKSKVEAKVENIKKKISTYPCGLSAPLYEGLKNLVKEQGQCYFYIMFSEDPDNKSFSILGVDDFEIMSETSKQSGINDNILYRLR